MNFNQILLLIVLGILPLAAVGYFLGQRKVLTRIAAGGQFHSTPDYYGWYAIILMFLPAAVLSVLALVLRITGAGAIPPILLVATWVLVPLVMLYPALQRIRPDLRARNFVERAIYLVLFSASFISILTTIGIVLAILFEALRFFSQVNILEFLTGTTWAPDVAFLGGAGRGEEMVSEPQFGAVPLYAGTFVITAIAMLVAVPVGVLSAIFLSEYASAPVRKIGKPLLEILAGIPTVVYGFFAAITVSPAVVRLADALGLEADYTNALSPGLIMGIMIIPFMSSLSDDVISSVPQNLRQASYAMGATSSETIKQIVLPAALPGIVSAFLLSVSRAIGETMIVVMAAGLRPNLTANPLEGMTTVTVRIVDALVGDQEFGSLETLSAFGLGLTLLIFTLMLNIVSLLVIRRFRKRYE